MFENIIGHVKIKEFLKNQESPSHAYLFSGIEGVGKFLMAKEYGHKLVGENGFSELDVINPEDTIKVDEIRKVIEKVHIKPLMSERKVVIINNAEKMTISAQNCLLKVLEEPPKYLTFILITSNITSLLDTVLSRCMLIKFQALNADEIKTKLLQLGREVNSETLELYNGGFLRLEEVEQDREGYEQIKRLFSEIDNTSKLEFLKNTKFIMDKKENMKKYLEYCIITLSKLVNKDLRYAKVIEIVQQTINNFNYNFNKEMLVDKMLIKTYEVFRK